MCVSEYKHSDGHFFVYLQGLREKYISNNVISTVNDFFDQWDPNTEKLVCGPQGVIC